MLTPALLATSCAQSTFIAVLCRQQPCHRGTQGEAFSATNVSRLTHTVIHIYLNKAGLCMEPDAENSVVLGSGGMLLGRPENKGALG